MSLRAGRDVKERGSLGRLLGGAHPRIWRDLPERVMNAPRDSNGGALSGSLLSSAEKRRLEGGAPAQH